MTYLAHRLSWRSVQRFVPVIEHVLTAHQNGIAHVAFDPKRMGISIDTAIARLRDAVQSLSQGLTSTPTINADVLTAIWPHYKVTSDGTNVLITSRTTEQEEPVLIHSGSRESIATLTVGSPRFVENLSAFALLLGQRLLQGEVTILGDLSAFERNRLLSENDIAIVQDGPQQYHML
jgi:hypothetical protein